MEVRIYSLLALMLVSAGCSKPGGDITAARAIEIADQIWAEDVPQMNMDDLDTRVEDLGNRWRVTYSAPEGSAGGPWFVVLSKKDGEIVSSGGGQ
jgi:hypothetical protein